MVDCLDCDSWFPDLIASSLSSVAVFNNDLFTLDPHEGLGIGIVAVEIFVDGLLKLGNADEHPPTDAFLRDSGEEVLDKIEPGVTGRR